MGVSPITHQAIAAWATLYNVDIGAWEVSVIDALDLHYRNICAEKADRATKGMTIQDVAQDAADLKAARIAQQQRRKAKQG